MRSVLLPLALLGSSMSLSACGGIQSTAGGTTNASEGGADAPGSRGPDGSAFDAADAGTDAADAFDAPSAYDAPFVYEDAACVDGSLAPEAGVQFPCGSTTCWSGSEFCAFVGGGAIMPTQGCNPVPCSCGANPTCACLHLPPVCTECTENAGAITANCQLP
jgi:hypothetical protein